MYKVSGAVVLTLALTACGGGGGSNSEAGNVGSDGTSSLVTPTSSTSNQPGIQQSLQGIWLGQCEPVADQPTSSQMVQFEINDDGSITYSEFAYLNNTNCGGDVWFSVNATGSYTTDGGQPGAVIPIDFRFTRVHATSSDGLAQIVSLEDIFGEQGITDINNIPFSVIDLPENVFTVYSLNGNSLSLGIDITANSGISPETRLPQVDTSFTGSGSVVTTTPVPTTPVSNGTSSLPIDPQTGIPTSGTAACGTRLTEGVTFPTTLVNTSAVCDYEIDGFIKIESDLTIEPGVAIRATADTTIIVDGGRIIAEGTAQDPIVIDGNVHVAGYWEGIDFREGRESSFDHFHMADAGQVCSLIFCPDVAFELDNVRVSFTNSSVSNSFVAGMLITDDVELVEFSNNRFFNNQRAGLIVDPELIPDIDAASDYSGGQFPNGTPMLAVRNGSHTQGRFYDWKKLSAPYFIGGFFNPEGGTWRVAPGVEIVMDEEAWISVEGNAVVKLIGTANEPIIIRGLESTAGFWDGIDFVDSDNDNIFEHVRISHFGNTENLASSFAAINMRDSQLTLNEVTIDNGRGDGIRCDEPFGFGIGGDRDGSFLRIIANVQITNITGVMVESECQLF